MSERSENFVKKQDWFCYYGIHCVDPSIGLTDNCKEDESIRYFDILPLISQEEDAVLRRFSVKNLMHLLSSERIKVEDKARILHIISEKIEQEPFYIEDHIKEFGLIPISIGKTEILKLPEELIKKAADLMEEYRQATKGTNCEKIAPHLEKFVDCSSFFVQFQKGEFSDEKVALLESALEYNPQALRHVNFSLFQENIYQMLGKEMVAYVMKFPNLSAQIEILSKENPDLLQIIVNKVKETPNLYDEVNLMEELIQYGTNNCYQINPEDLKDPSRLIDAALRNNRSKRDNQVIAVPYSSQYQKDLETAWEAEYQKAKQEEWKSLGLGYQGIYFGMSGNPSRLDVIKNIYLNRYFAMSLAEAKNFIKMYGQNLEGMQSESARELIQQINEVLAMEEESQIDFQKGKSYSIEEKENIKRGLEKEYALSYVTELQKTGELIDQDPGQSQIDFQGRKIKIVEMPEEFNLLVHSTGAGFVNPNQMREGENYQEKWTESDHSFNHILSMSYINQDFLGMAPVSGRGVIYGFHRIEQDSIRLMGETDINTFSNGFGYSSEHKKYLTAKAMPYHSRRVYNEIGIERKGTMPNYVLLFDDSSEETIQSTYQAAADWNIPVIFCDKTKIKDRQIANLERLRLEFQEKKDPRILKELLNTYETNMAGWLLNRSKEKEDQSHTQEINHERFRQSFEEEYQKIEVTLDQYLDQFANLERGAQDEDLIRMMQIVLEEQDLYERSMKQAPISKTEITMDTGKILQKIDQTMKTIGLNQYAIDLSNIPTAEEYRKSVTMKQFMKNALLDQRVTAEEVQAVERELITENAKEERKEEHE